MDVRGYTKNWGLDQGQFLGNDQLFQALYNAPLTDDKRDGICTGLSMIWLARRMMFHNETAEQRASAIFTNAAFRWGGKSQDIHLAAGTGAGAIVDQMKAMYDGPLAAYALKIVASNCKAKFSSDPDDLAYTATDVADPSGTYALWNIGLQTSTGSAGHMVASYSSRGSIIGGKHFYFFDPNMGEYRIPAKHSYDFCCNMFESYASAFQGLTYVAAFEVDR
jgi:hypothetical protein